MRTGAKAKLGAAAWGKVKKAEPKVEPVVEPEVKKKVAKKEKKHDE